MADEELLQDDEELVSEFDEIKPPRKKRSWLKWLFIIIILLIAIIAALYSLNRLGYVDLPIEKYLPVEKLLEGSSDAITVEPEPKALVPPLPPAPQIPEKSVKKPVKPSMGKLTPGYYLKVGSCLDMACRIEIMNRMKSLKLPVVQRKGILRTTYYELISDSSYQKQRAEEKLRLLNQYNETIGFPYLLRTRNNRYVVSFGQFPQKSSAIQMKSQLEHLFPQIRMRFALRPRKDNVTITKLLVGPYSKKDANQIRMKLRDRLEFEWVEIAKFP